MCTANWHNVTDGVFSSRKKAGVVGFCCLDRGDAEFAAGGVGYRACLCLGLAYGSAADNSAEQGGHVAADAQAGKVAAGLRSGGGIRGGQPRFGFGCIEGELLCHACRVLPESGCGDGRGSVWCWCAELLRCKRTRTTHGAALTAYLAIPRGGTGPATSTGAQAKDAALQTGRHYLEALSGGDAAGALRLSATAPSTTQWVTADALHAQLAAAPITNIAVTSAPSAPSDNPNDVQYVLLSAQIGPTLSQARVAVRRHGDDWKLDNTTVPVDRGQ